MKKESSLQHIETQTKEEQENFTKFSLDVDLNPEALINFIDFNTSEENVMFIDRIKFKNIFLNCRLIFIPSGNRVIWFIDYNQEITPTEEMIQNFNTNLVKSFYKLNLDMDLIHDSIDTKWPILNLNPSFDPEELEKNINDFIKGMKIYYQLLANELKETGKKKIKYKIPDPLFGVEIGDETEEEGIKKFLVKSNTKFSDIGGYEGIKKKLKLIVDIKKNKKNLERYGIKPEKGIILYGPPGTGKTLMAKTLAGELKGKFYHIKSSDIFDKWVGSSGKNINNILKNLPDNSILFIDEIDAIFNKYSQNETENEVLSLFLQFMDGINNNDEKSILVIGATNKKENINEAVLRSGRLGTHLEVGLPDIKARIKIFQVHIEKINNQSETLIFNKINFRKLAENSEKLSGADIKELLRDLVTERISPYIKKNKFIKIRKHLSTKCILKKIFIFKQKNQKKNTIGFKV